MTKIRTHNDGKGDEISKATAFDFSHPVIVRPEFGPDTDIRTILRRHGALPMATRTPLYTETDYDIDLTTALGQIQRAKQAFHELPAKHREKFKNPEDLYRAWQSGELDRPAPTPAPPQTEMAPSGTTTTEKVKPEALTSPKTD